MSDVRHWHVAYGLVGYGPEGSDGFLTATSLPGVADLISTECDRSSDQEIDAADTCAKGRDYEDAWKTRKRADELATIALNFAADRAKSPAYVDRPDLWDATVERLIGETFPLDVSNNTRLYVWECDTGACEHLAEELQEA